MRGYEDEDERSVGEVAETLYSKVTHYHAQIGPAVKKEALNELEWKLLSEAKDLFHRAMYEEALGPDHSFVGVGLHNVGLVHWGLGDHAAAQARLEKAQP